jgi:hypothetical protein
MRRSATCPIVIFVIAELSHKEAATLTEEPPDAESGGFLLSLVRTVFSSQPALKE